MNPTDAETLMLLMAHMLALGVACGIFVCMILLHRRGRVVNQSLQEIPKKSLFHPESAPRPASWLAVRSAEPQAVRVVLPDKHEFQLSPRVNGWVIVTGSGLPSPSDDVDAVFLFLTALSRELGHVQFFYAEKFSAHHAWARMDEGCVTRAYAWTGETIWNQGAKTLMETEMGMKCSNYGESFDTEFWMTNQTAAANVEKIPLLAARWSIDPAILHRTDESARFS